MFWQLKELEARFSDLRQGKNLAASEGHSQTTLPRLIYKVKTKARYLAVEIYDCHGGAMTEPIWKFEHAVVCVAPREFAWKYWTNPMNWDDPPARFEFDGPFAAGTKVKTILPGQTLESLIQSVEPGQEATIVLAYGGATISFRWGFAEVPTERTKVSQRIELSGTSDRSVVEQAKVFEETVPEGMKKIKQRIESAWQMREH